MTLFVGDLFLESPPHRCPNALAHTPDPPEAPRSRSVRGEHVSTVRPGLGSEIGDEIAEDLGRRGSKSRQAHLSGIESDAGQDWIPCPPVRKLTLTALDVLQVLLDQDRTFQRASGQFAVGIAFRILRCGPFFFFDADQHFCKQKAL